MRPRPRRAAGYRPGGRSIETGGVGAHSHLHLDQPAPYAGQAANGAPRGACRRDRQRELRAPFHGRCRMVVRGRLAHGARFPLPLRGIRDQGRCGDDQHPRYGRLRRPRGIRRVDRHAFRSGTEHRPRRVVGALPQRLGARRRQLAQRGARRGTPDRVHRQRSRRACRQRRDGRDRHGASDAQRCPEF